MACICGAGLWMLMLLYDVQAGLVRMAVANMDLVIAQDSRADFSAACAVLPELLAQPELTQITVSPVHGGELRLQATFEDYFDGVEIDSTRWISGYSNAAYPSVPPPQIVDGLARLDANYLRARNSIGAETPVRFFEASARFVTAPAPVAYADLGFYRSLPPLRVLTETSSIRLFVTQTTIESATPRHMYVRSKDGLFTPSTPPAQGALDTVVDAWGASSSAQFAGLNQFRTYAIHWGQTTTAYLIDGAPVITAPVGASQPLPHAGVSTLPTYVLLYSQDPSFFDGGRSPLLVDWVRAGAYAAQGSYTSCITDAGQVVNWSRLTLSATVPAGTEILLESRTSQDGVSWSSWTPAGAVVHGVSTVPTYAPAGRYFQYRATLRTTDVRVSPELGRIERAYFEPVAVRVQPALAFVNPTNEFAFTGEVIDRNAEPLLGYPASPQWAVVNGGGAINANGVFRAGGVTGSYTDTVVATIPSLTPGVASVRVGVAPTVTVNVCCPGLEGVPITLTASSSVGDQRTSHHYSWDLNGDDVFDDAVGATVTYIFPKEGDYPVQVLAANSLGFTATAQAVAKIVNVPPQIVAIQTNSPVRPLEPLTIEVIAVDVPADILTYAFELNDDGVYGVAETNRVTTNYATPGTRTIRVRVHDDGGGEAVGSQVVVVEPFQLFLPLTVRR